MKIILNKEDILNILAWGGLLRANLEDTNFPFGSDEIRTLKKIRNCLSKKEKKIFKLK